MQPTLLFIISWGKKNYDDNKPEDKLPNNKIILDINILIILYLENTLPLIWNDKQIFQQDQHFLSSPKQETGMNII